MLKSALMQPRTSALQNADFLTVGPIFMHHLIFAKMWDTCDTKMWDTCGSKMWETCDMKLWDKCDAKMWDTCDAKMWVTVWREKCGFFVSNNDFKNFYAEIALSTNQSWKFRTTYFLIRIKSKNPTVGAIFLHILIFRWKHGFFREIINFTFRVEHFCNPSPPFNVERMPEYWPEVGKIHRRQICKKEIILYFDRHLRCVQLWQTFQHWTGGRGCENVVF